MFSSEKSPAQDLRSERHVLEWMDQFQEAVRARDFAAGRKLFHEDVVSFGTVAGRVGCLDELVEKQWACRWPLNGDFRFDPDSTAVISGEPEIWIVLVSWSTLDDALADFRRHGRATLVLRAHARGLLCVHSHFSLVP